MDVLQSYLSGIDELRAAYDGMTREELHAYPIEGKWSAMEVLCHLVDIDLMTAMRVRAALLRETPRLPASTGEELTAKLAVGARDAEEELLCFETIRRQAARIVRSLPESVLERAVMLVKASGEEVTRTVATFLKGIAPHVGHHLDFVAQKRLAMGAARR